MQNFQLKHYMRRGHKARMKMGELVITIKITIFGRIIYNKIIAWDLLALFSISCISDLEPLGGDYMSNFVSIDDGGLVLDG